VTPFVVLGDELPLPLLLPPLPGEVMVAGVGLN